MNNDSTDSLSKEEVRLQLADWDRCILRLSTFFSTEKIWEIKEFMLTITTFPFFPRS